MKEPLIPQVFDAQVGWYTSARKLPHWSQTGTLTFITFRTCDSIPKLVLKRWCFDRDRWLEQHRISVANKNWREELEQLTQDERDEYKRLFTHRWENLLDECHGECFLRRPELAKIVSDSLLHFDAQRYALTDFAVMPNHVHLIAAFLDAESMLDQCKSWKHYTATKINQQLNRKGNFWQQDGFDHLVRSAEQFEALRKYIANNPVRAYLAEGEYIHYSRPA